MFTDVVCLSKLKTIKTQQINNNYSMLMKHEKKIKTINKQKNIAIEILRHTATSNI